MNKNNKLQKYLGYISIFTMVFALASCKSAKHSETAIKIANVQTEFNNDKSVLVSWEHYSQTVEYEVNWSADISSSEETANTNTIITTEPKATIPFLPGQAINLSISAPNNEFIITSDPVFVQFPPSPPEQLEIVKEPRKNLLSWQATNSATGYVLRAFESKNESDIVFIELTETHYTHEELIADSQWTYSLIAINEAGESLPTDSVSVSTQKKIPSKITGVKIVYQEDKSALITWDADPMANEYKIDTWFNTLFDDYSTVQTVKEPQFRLEFSPGNSVEISIAGIGDEVGDSADLPHVKFVPPRPQNFKVIAENANNFLKWDTVYSADHYTIYTLSDDERELLAEVNTANYRHQQVEPDSKWRYVVVAVNESGESFASEEVEVTALNYPPLIPRPLNDTGVRYAIGDNNIFFYEYLASREPFFELPPQDNDNWVDYQKSGSPIIYTSYPLEFYPKIPPAAFAPVNQPDQFPGQDGNTGRDTIETDDSDGKGGFSFTKLDATSGTELPSDAMEYGCVKDNVTGLFWENKTGAAAIDDLHSAARRFSWYDPNPETNGGNEGQKYAAMCDSAIYGGNTHDFTQAVNAEKLCGFNDWRMPTSEELRSIIDYEVKIGTLEKPAMTDQKFFPNVSRHAHLWTSQTPGFRSHADRAFSMHMHEGQIQAHSKFCNYIFLYSVGVMLVR